MCVITCCGRPRFRKVGTRDHFELSKLQVYTIWVLVDMTYPYRSPRRRRRRSPGARGSRAAALPVAADRHGTGGGTGNQNHVSRFVHPTHSRRDLLYISINPSTYRGLAHGNIATLRHVLLVLVGPQAGRAASSGLDPCVKPARACGVRGESCVLPSPYNTVRNESSRHATYPCLQLAQ